MQKRDVLNSPRLKELRRRRGKVARTKILFVFVCLILVFGIMGAISHWEKMSIQNIEISGNKTISESAIKNIIEKEISSKYFFIFSKKNIVLYPKTQIIEVLSSEFLKLQTVKLNLKESNTLLISVSEREAVYTWCGDEPDTNPDVTRCYFTDNTGFVFDEAPYFSGDIYFKIFGILTPNVDSPLGSRVYPDIFNSLIDFKKNLEQMNLNPVSMYIKEDGDVEIYLAPGKTSLTQPKILINSKNNFVEVVENLQTAISSDPLQKDLKDRYSSLLYIDLRFDNKVYYRFQ